MIDLLKNLTFFVIVFFACGLGLFVIDVYAPKRKNTELIFFKIVSDVVMFAGVSLVVIGFGVSRASSNGECKAGMLLFCAGAVLWGLATIARIILEIKNPYKWWTR